ncbi:DUF2062 domain-containing protein [Methylogaea oryzae]|nr:DUF2062 domain-containing protein [Methylogaea oryzae]
MPKRLFQRYMPDPDKIRKIEGLQFLGDRLHSPNLWHINRRSVANAFACGLFAMYTPPLPWQMAIAAVLAVFFSANLPIAVSLVWITNPVTWIPMYYFAYRVGALLLGRDTFAFSAFSQVFSLETAWELGAPFLLGCLILMVLGAAAGYFGVHALWRRHVQRAWDERKLRRQGIVVEHKPLIPGSDKAVALLSQAWVRVEPHAKALWKVSAEAAVQAWASPPAERIRTLLQEQWKILQTKAQAYLNKLTS